MKIKSELEDNLENSNANTNIVDNGFRRLATVAAFVSLFAYAVSMCVTPASINEIRSFFHTTSSQEGLIYGVFMIGFLIAVLTGGQYSDKHGKLPMILLGCVFMALGAFIFSRTMNFNYVLVAIFIMGVGGGFSEAVSMAIISDLYEAKQRTAMMLWAQVGFSAGAIFSPLFIARLLKIGVSWRLGYIAAAIICVIAALFALAGAATGREKLHVADERSSDWRNLLSNKLVIWLSIGILLYVGAEIGQSSWLAAYFERNLNSSAPLAASSVAFFWGGIGLGRIAAAWISKYCSNFTLICGSLGMAAIFEAILLLAGIPAHAIIATVGLGFCLGPVWPTILSCAGEAYPEQSGLVFGIVVAAGGIGAAVFPTLIGRASDMFGLHMSLWVCFVILVINFFIFANLQRRSMVCE